VRTFRGVITALSRGRGKVLEKIAKKKGEGGSTDLFGCNVTVTNTGAREGTEVVQLYLRHDAASVTRPVRELKRFARVTLKPGDSRTVRFTLGAEDMAFYDLDLRRVVEPGTITLFAGGSSAAALEAHLTVNGETRVLAPAPPRVH